MSVYGNDTFGNGNSPRVNMDKKLDLDEAGSNYQVLTGVVHVYVMWAAEKGGRIIKKKIDLNAFAAGANTAHEFVAACHADFPSAADKAMEYGGDLKAKAGESAQEFVRLDLDALCARGDIEDIIFGATCLGNPLAMAGLGELSVKITVPTFKMNDGQIVKDSKGQPVVESETILVPSQLRSIEDRATAALFYRLHLTPNGAQLRRVTDLSEYEPPRRIDGKQMWRDLLGGLRSAIQRAM